MKRKRKEIKDKKFRRGIYILPSTFTIGNIFCGFYAIIASFKGEFYIAAMLIGIAFILDSLDGRIARLTHSTSPFGKQFDSLADIISFGVAPSLLIFSWAFTNLGRVGWLTSLIFIICGAMRLARFNIQKSHADSRYFIGLPIPATAFFLATMVFYYPNQIESKTTAIFIMGLVYLVSFLMISKLRYRSFKDIEFHKRKPYFTIIIIALFFWLVLIHPQVILLALSSSFVLSGILSKMLALRRRRKLLKPSPQEEKVAEEHHQL